MKFTWDNTIVDTAPASVTEGDLLTNLGATFFTAYVSGPHEITVDCALLGAQPGATGPGTMFHIEFAGLMPGISPVGLTIVSVRDSDNNHLTGFTADDGNVMVYSHVLDCTQIDVVDIGNLTSESGHNLDGWGPIEPAHSGGGFGGIDDCRVIYASAANGDGNEWATVDLDFGQGPLTSKCLIIDHLDGHTVDAFEVYVYPPGQPGSAELVYVYPGDETTTEIWYRTTIPILASGTQTVKFVSTEDPWSQWHIYGQVAFDSLIVEDCFPTKDLVDIGNPSSESGHNLEGWGPIEPAHSGGNFGGVADCRAIFASLANGDGTIWAGLDLYFGECDDIPKCLVMRHLDGYAKDAFDAYIHPPGQPESAVLIFSYPGDDLVDEIWLTSTASMFVTGMWTVRLVSTEPPWSGWATYGQVALDTILVKDCAEVITQVVSPSPTSTLVTEPMHPNPFQHTTHVKFLIPGSGLVRLDIYDLAGREIRRLMAGVLPAGNHRLAWDGRDDQGRQVAGGLYLYRLEVSGKNLQTGKVLLLK
jgi:hypothetical protein